MARARTMGVEQAGHAAQWHVCDVVGDVADYRHGLERNGEVQSVNLVLQMLSEFFSQLPNQRQSKTHVPLDPGAQAHPLWPVARTCWAHCRPFRSTH